MNLIATTAKDKFGELLHAKNLWTIVLGIILTMASFYVASAFDFQVWDEPKVRASGIMLAVGLFLAIGPFALKVLAWVYALAVVLRTGQAAQIPDALEATVAGAQEEEKPAGAPGQVTLDGPVTTLQGPPVQGENQNGMDPNKP